MWFRHPARPLRVPVDELIALHYPLGPELVRDGRDVLVEEGPPFVAAVLFWPKGDEVFQNFRGFQKRV